MISAGLLLVLALNSASDTVAIRAGRVYTAEGGAVLEDATVLVRDGRIAEIGADVTVPPGARVVDYGPDAVLVPGLVAADSLYATGRPSDRTADPDVQAIDNFDPYTPYWNALVNGVTTVYLAPARGRLIAGQGAVVKSAGASRARVLSERAGLHGSIGAEARRTRGYWEPPVPATVDVGIMQELAQLPRTTMGAIVALGELLRLSQGEHPELADLYGERAGASLAELIEARAPWRMGAESEGEVRALLGFAREHSLPLVVEGGSGAGRLAEALAESGTPVVFRMRYRSGNDFGKRPDDAWPTPDTAARFARAGVKLAIVAPESLASAELRFAAALARRGGMSPEAALQAITLAPAEILGVADRVGSLAPGKDADLVVLSGPPLEVTSDVLATWVDGEVVWKADETAAVVLEVDELFVGDGEVLSPGQLLMQDGLIVEVGRRVSHPRGATVVRGPAAMPGMIDAFGHLGLEGSSKRFSTDFGLSRLIAPGDHADRRVALAGVTTVHLASRANPGSGSPTMAYKPAGDGFDDQVIDDPTALHMTWTDENRFESGEKVREALEKAKKYAKEWEDYEKALAEWEAKPSRDEPDDEDEEDEKDEDDSDEEEDEKDEKEEPKESDDDDGESAPVTGVWEGELTTPSAEAATRLRVQLLEAEGRLEGNLRCDGLSEDLVALEGERADRSVILEGLGSRGWIELTLEVTAATQLEGEAEVEGESASVELERTSAEYRVAGRAARTSLPERPAPEKNDDDGAPQPPKRDDDLEPLRRAMAGDAAVLVTVTREDEILECVDTFEDVGIRPVLFGADRAHEVAEALRDRVAGVILTRQVTVRDPKEGMAGERNRYAELAAAGIPVAFHSGAEEGAVELPIFAAYAVSEGMSPAGALRALTHDAAAMLAIEARVGRLAGGMDADVLLLDGDPLDVSTTVTRVWVNGKEVRLP